MKITEERTEELLDNQNLDQLIKEAQESTLAEPKWGQGWKALGLAFYKQKNIDEALKALRKASMLLLKDAEVYSALGSIAQDQQQPKQAESYFNYVIKLNPSNLTILNKLGSMHLENEEPLKAIDIFKEITTLKPTNFLAHLQLAKAYKLNKEPKKYRLALIQAGKVPPSTENEYAELAEYWIDSQFTKEGLVYLNNLQKKYPNNKTLPYLQAIIATKAGNPKKAVTLLEKANKLDENNPKIVVRLAYLQKDYDLKLAISNLEQLLKNKPNNLDALRLICYALLESKQLDKLLHYLENLAEVKLDLITYSITGFYRYEIHNFKGSVAAFEEYLALNGNLDDIALTYTNSLIKCSQFKVAIKILKEHLKTLPKNNNELLAQLSVALYGAGENEEAIKVSKKLTKIKNVAANDFSSYLFFLLHSDKIAIDTLYSEHKRFGDYAESNITPYNNHKNLPDPNKKLKIGFVSGDMYNHAVAYFARTIFRSFNKDEFEITVFSNLSLVDSVTEELMTLVDHWSQVESLNDIELSELIISKEIDILIDLSGHTGNNRLTAFAYKPAPLQITAIGCPYTTGLKAMDYSFASNFIDNLDHYQSIWTESLIIIQRQEFSKVRPHRRKEATQPLNDLAVKRNGFFTYASLNRFSKINDQALAAWVKILQLNKNSKLMLGNVEEAQLPEIVELFYTQGISADRLILKPRMGLESYMGLFHQIDLMLDTWPYGGGTTSNDARAMGVPVLYLKGNQPIQARSNSSNKALGLTQFSTENIDDYIKAAVAWADKLDTLQAVRTDLLSRPEQSTDKCSPWSIALRMAWQRWCAGLPVESFTVDLDA